MIDWSGKKVIILGAARQGLALARYLAGKGAQVVITDQQPEAKLESARQALVDVAVDWICGEHPLFLLDQADCVCPSGGVPLTIPFVVEAQRRGIPLSNDSQIFLEAAPCLVVGITGSAGKTTTTSLVWRMAEQAASAAEPRYRRTWVGGNIGVPLITVVDEMQPADLAIVELSSFQLEIMNRSPQIAAVLNITPNHLDRHGTMEAYQAAKVQILEHQEQAGVAVLGRDDPCAWSLRGKVKGQQISFGFSPLPEDQPGVTLQGDQVVLQDERGTRPVLTRRDVALRGEHNLLNVMAACAIGAAADLPTWAMRQGVSGFTGVAHRLEFIRSWGGADWYNDSIATAPERVIAGLRSFTEPLVLLVGGRDKDLPWQELAELAGRRVRHLVVFGEAASKILPVFKAAAGSQLSISYCVGLRQAVQVAAQVIQPGDVVLLSPGGTSFDEFKDFEERGRWFAKWVNELK